MIRVFSEIIISVHVPFTVQVCNLPKTHMYEIHCQVLKWSHIYCKFKIGEPKLNLTRQLSLFSFLKYSTMKLSFNLFKLNFLRHQL